MDEVSAQNRAVDDVKLTDIIVFLTQYYLFLLIPAVVAGLICAAQIASLPVEYEATTLLVVAPGGKDTDFTSPTLNIQAYQKRMESQAIRRAAATTLIKDGVLKPSDNPWVKVITKINPATRSNESAVLEASGYGDSPATAKKVTTVWVQTFIETIQRTITETNTVASQVLLRQLNDSRTALSKLEDELAQAAEKAGREMQASIDRQEAAIVAARIKAAEQLSAYEIESRQKLESLQGELNLALRESELEARRGVLQALQKEEVELRPQLSTRKLKADALHKRLEATPPVVTLRRGFSDDAIWSAIGKTPDWTALQKQTLFTELVNPLFQHLTGQVADEEVYVQVQNARLEQIQKDIAAAAKDVRALAAELARDKHRLYLLEQERAGGLYKLKQSTQLEVALAERHRDEGVEALDALYDENRRRAERIMAPQREQAQQLARNWNGVVQAKAKAELVDLRVGAEAVEPSTPVNTRIVIYSFATAFVGAFGGLLIALIVAIRRRRPTAAA